MDDMNEILRARKNAQAPSNLAERIIDASLKQASAQKTVSLLEELSSMFILPRPALVIAACLVLSLGVGLQIGNSLNGFTDSEVFFYGEADAGEWL